MTSRRIPSAASDASPSVRLSDILDSAGAAIYTMDLQGRITFLNRSAVNALGYDPTEAAGLIGIPFFDLVPPQAKAEVAATMRRGAMSPMDVHTFRTEILRKDGSAITIEVRATPLWRDGEVDGRVGVAYTVDPAADAPSRDLLERLLLEDRRRIAAEMRERIDDVIFTRKTETDDPDAEIEGDLNRSPAADTFRRHGLDGTDLTILRLVIDGASNPEIGSKVHLSAATVKDRIRRLMRQFGATRRAELAAQALRSGIH